MSKLRVSFFCVILMVFFGCAGPPKKIYPVGTPPNEVIYDTASEQIGKASFYYGRWIGHITANGEIYRASDITAAHKTLPFHTRVRVTNLRNGKSVIVRINNRGPYVKGRILDLSLVAAQKIEMTAQGVATVKMEVLRAVPELTKPNLKRSPGMAPVKLPPVTKPETASTPTMASKPAATTPSKKPAPKKTISKKTSKSKNKPVPKTKVSPKKKTKPKAAS